MADVVISAAVWTLLVFGPHPASSSAGAWPRLGAIGVVVFTSITAAASQRMYRSRVRALDGPHGAGVARVGVATAAVGAIVVPYLGVSFSPLRAAAGGLLSVLGLMLAQSVVTAWTRSRRTRGDVQQRFILVGTNSEARDLAQLLAVHHDLGYRVCGVVGDEVEWAHWGLDVPWLGDASDVATNARLLNAGVIVAVTGFEVEELDALVRGLARSGVTVHTSSGLRRIDQGRIRVTQIAREPMFLIQPHSASPVEDWCKRALDVVLSVALLVLAAPVLAVAIAAVKIDSAGPVLFRQQRVGKDGQPFEILKLRTMVMDAQKMCDALGQVNERQGGPLFKLDSDPRVTRSGWFLRMSSVDEVPQLINVIRGEMSLVGPRPALFEEAQHFDEELLTRFSVKPGITGLWQLEARDNPAFAAYRRLDLFYVENRSFGMDLAILLRTAAAVTGRALHAFHRQVTAGQRPHELGTSSVPAVDPNCEFDISRWARHRG